MLKFLRRKRTVKILLWIIAVVIIFAFVLWGTPSRFDDKQNNMPSFAGEIFGKKISPDRFVEAYQASRNQAIMIYGQEYEKYAQFMNLEEDAWNRLVLLETAKNIKVSNDELIKKIRTFAFFQKNGKFDKETYNLLLKYVFRASARNFEEQIRQSLTIEKLIQEALNKVSVADEELENAYAKENETAIASYILVKNEDFKSAEEIPEEGLKKFYDAHQENFKKPKQVNVQYIKIDFGANKENLEVTDEEIRNYYEEHKEEFVKPAAVDEAKEGEKEGNAVESVEYKNLEEVREEIKNIILADKNQQKVREEAYEVSDFLYEGHTFEEAAQKFSLPLGETGLFSSVDSIPDIGWSYQFLTAAFEIEKGQISDVIQTPKGYYIIKLVSKREPHIPLLEEIKTEVQNAYSEEKSKLKAKEKSDELLAVIEKEKNTAVFDFAKTAEQLGFELQTTESFKRDGYIPSIGEAKEFSEEAFKLNAGEISRVIEVPKGYAILRLDEKKPYDKEKFAREKEDFKNNLLANKRQQYYSEWFKKLKEQANLKNNLSALGKK